MILESVLAILVVLAIASSLKSADYMKITWPTDGTAGNPILAFALAVGYLAHGTFGISVALGSIIGILMVEGFVVTTLDSAVRLNRYVFEELWRRIFNPVPKLFTKYWFNSGLAVVFMFGLAVSNGYRLIWPVFGASNQLLAALTLIAVTVWLNLAGKKSWYTFFPAVIMVATTIAALVYNLAVEYIPKMNITLIITDIILLALSLGVVVLAIKKTFLMRKTDKSLAVSS
jgi:carbon starvation protein